MHDTPLAASDPQWVRIAAHPKYRELKRKRNTLGWLLTGIMLVAYYGFIGLIAFDKAFLAQRIGTGVTTLGIPVAVGVIVLTIVLTGLYVHRANRTFDRLTREILAETAA